MRHFLFFLSVSFYNTNALGTTEYHSYADIQDPEVQRTSEPLALTPTGCARGPCALGPLTSQVMEHLWGP